MVKLKIFLKYANQLFKSLEECLKVNGLSSWLSTFRSRNETIAE